MHSLRARIFVTVAIALVVATAFSSVLSRRATLVEEQQILRPMPIAHEDAAAVAQTAFLAGGWPAVSSALARLAATSGSRFIAIGPGRTVLAASDPELARAKVTIASAGDELRIQLEREHGVATIDVRGSAPQKIAGTSAVVYQLPNTGGAAMAHPSGPPPWIAWTLATALVTIAVTFVVSNRILRPVQELTIAARALEAGDRSVRVAASGHDEIGQLARAFNDMAERLAGKERLERQLVSDVAHELRSPVTNLRCTLEAMQDGLVPFTAAQVNALHGDTLLLQRLIADLQELALAEAGGLRLQSRAVDLGELARKAATVEPGGAPVSIRVAADVPAVRADPDRLEQVLRNLLTNAKRHTPPDGRITIDVSRIDSRVRVDVTDTGEGLAAEHVPLVFERFYRVDPSRDRSTGGAGLGLAIARRLVEAHGGSIEAASEGPGRGARFTFFLPA